MFTTTTTTITIIITIIFAMTHILSSKNGQHPAQVRGSAGERP
jgi:hypothetical protein